jgi:GNAT superfamily N-acetyltransferase
VIVMKDAKFQARPEIWQQRTAPLSNLKSRHLLTTPLSLHNTPPNISLTMADQKSQKASDVLVEIIDHEQDFTTAFAIISKCFGRQTNDAFWKAMNPGWDTPEGAAAGTKRMVQRWKSVTKNESGKENTVHLKASVPDPQIPGKRVIAGIAIWAQHSMIDGMGDKPSTNIDTAVNSEDLYPGNEPEQRFLRQCFASFVAQRVKTLEEKATTSSPATFSLDLCVVDPDFQRRGIANKLVEWGLEEAKRRGGLESTTEGSAMGRFVYQKLGFRPVEEVVYDVDPEFRDRKLPPNLFMRTGTSA